MNLKQTFLYTIICATAFWGCSENPDTQTLENPASDGSQYPYLYSTQNALYMSWLSDDKSDQNTLKYARYADDQWSNSQTVAADSGWFVNWADFPSIIADDTGPVASHWLNKKSGGPYAYDVNISIADSAGNWRQAITPHHDGTATEHGFVSMVPWDKETVLAVWLDGRRTANRADDQYSDLTKAMTLRGALISRDDGQLQDQFLIDESVCDCCSTSLIKTKTGAIVAYRNRTDDEIRDIYISRFDGQIWSQPQAVFNDEWKIGGCPVNGPKIAASDSTVAVAWHTGAGESPATKVAISSDNGKTFGDPILLSKKRSLGRTDADIYNGRVYISWMEERKEENQAKLQLAVINSGSHSREVKTISSINGSRETGFPQMEIFDGQLIFAWTDADSAQSSIILKKKILPFKAK